MMISRPVHLEGFDSESWSLTGDLESYPGAGTGWQNVPASGPLPVGTGMGPGRVAVVAKFVDRLNIFNTP